MAVHGPEPHALVERAAAAQVMLTVFHNRRWDSDHLTVRRLDGRGPPRRRRALRVAVRALATAARPRRVARGALAPTTGEGCSSTSGSHLVDQARHCSGPSPTSTPRWRRAGAGLTTTCSWPCATPRGPRSHLWASAVAAAPGPRLRVLGSRGGLRRRPSRRAGGGAARRSSSRRAGFGVEPPERWGRLVRGDAGEPVASERGRWSAFYPGVVQALRGLHPPPVDPRDAPRYARRPRGGPAQRGRARRGGRVARPLTLTRELAPNSWTSNIRNRICVTPPTKRPGQS